MADYLLGIDLGTTAVKVILVDLSGRIVSSGSAGYALLTPRPNWTEQDPEDWWLATIAAVNLCLEHAGQAGKRDVNVVSVGLSGQMHGSVFLDARGNVLRPAILWNDQRTIEQCEYINQTIGKEKLVELTSNRAIAGFTAPKILWLKQNEPDVYGRVEQVLLPKDYIRFRMTGAFATEVSDASGTLLFDVQHRKWSAEMLEALDIPQRWMPDCCESPDISSYVSRDTAAALNLACGTPVAGGAGDQAAGAVGNGIVKPGVASCAIGTSGVIFWHCDMPVCDKQARLHSFCHAIPGKWHLMGVTLAAGGSLRWFRDCLCQDIKLKADEQGIDPYRIITDMVEDVWPGCEGLMFLPYLAGERTPYADASARGAFLGLSLRHGRAHMARAVMEGITMSMKDCLELGKESGMETSRIILSGGGARSTLWQQLSADIFECDVARVGSDEGPAYGAAILAGVGIGVFETVGEACGVFIKERDVKHPDTLRGELYRQMYGIYRRLYSGLKDFNERNAEFVNDNATLRGDTL